MWPATGITSSEQVPTAIRSSSPTRWSTVTPVCSAIASASGSPATTSAPVAGDDLGEGAVVVPVLVGGHDRGEAAVADQLEQPWCVVGGVDQDLLPGVGAAQQVAVVGHLRVDGELGHLEPARPYDAAARRRGRPHRCSRGGWSCGHQPSIDGSSPREQDKVSGAGRPVSHQPRSAAGPVTTSPPPSPRHRSECPDPVDVERADLEPRGRVGPLGHGVEQEAGEGLGPVAGRVAGVEVDVVDLQLAQPHHGERAARIGDRPASARPGPPTVVGEGASASRSGRRAQQAGTDLAGVGRGERLDVGVARLVGVVHRRRPPSSATSPLQDPRSAPRR